MMEEHSRQRYEDYKSFMQRHRITVWRVCYDFAHGDIQRCEDMVQEVWIMLWLKFDTTDSRSEWQQRLWVRKVTRNVLIDLYRKSRFDPLSGTSNLSDKSDLSDESVNADLAERIDDLFSLLSPDEQRLMRMRLDGYSTEEIATAFGIAPNAVYQRVNRIMKKLKAITGES